MSRPVLCRCDDTCHIQNIMDGRCCGWFMTAEAGCHLDEETAFDPWENAPSQVETLKRYLGSE